MRIGIDYTAAVRQGAGIGRYTRELVKALAELNRSHDYVLFAAAGGQRPVDTGWPPNFQMRSVPLSDRALAILWHRLQLPLWVELVTGPVDIFHSPDFGLPPVRRAKTLVTVHDLSFIRYPQCADANLRAYLNKVVPRSVHRADLILADSQSTKGDLVELLGVESGRIEVVYPGVEERFHPIEDQAHLEKVRKRYNLPPRFILGLGTLQPRKNFTHLIEAYSLLVTHYSSLQLVITGGKGWLYEEIFATVEQLGLEDKVVFPGFVADEHLPALYNLADLFVFPSLYEGFGLPPLEAMACGTPVITSNASSLPEVVGKAGLMVEATEVEALTEAMKQVLEDDALREGMMAKGVKQASKFTWEKAAAKLLSLYETLE
ncbi:MAG: glycosyltransferase family 4 protein [Anaerolineales bacterium]|nr:glycosyltransferase family 4 protein [Anaerolineales bacterium]